MRNAGYAYTTHTLVFIFMDGSSCDKVVFSFEVQSRRWRAISGVCFLED